MPSYKDDMLGALAMVTLLYEAKEVTESCGYYIVMFKDTTTTLSFDAKQVTLAEIQEIIDEAKSD